MATCANEIVSDGDRLAEALRLSEQALEILDSVAGVPGDIGAHLDLGINRLKEFMDVHDETSESGGPAA